MILRILPSEAYDPCFAVIDLKKCTIKIQDGTTPTANSVSIKMSEGTLSWTESVNREYHLDRGSLDSVRDGDEVPMEITIDGVYEYYKGNADSYDKVGPIDALKKINAASAWVSSSADACEPYAVDIVLLFEPDCGNDEQLTFPDFRYESIEFDVREGTIRFSGKCNATEPTVVRPV